MASETNDVNSHNGANSKEEIVRGRLVPRQLRRLKRVGILAGCLLVGLVGLRWWWGFEAHRRLEAEIGRYQAAGQPVYVREFDALLDAIPGEDNAALLLEKAINALTFTTESGVRFSDFMDESDTFDKKPEAAEELIESNANPLRLARQARHMRQVAWSERLQNYAATGLPLGLWSSQRSLARLLWFAACYHYRAGNYVEAIETTHDLLAFSEAVGAHPTVIATLVAWACYELGVSLLEDFGAGLTVDRTAAKQEGEVRSARREQVKELIDALLRDDGARRALIHSCYSDRAFYLYYLDPVKESVVGALTGNVPQPPSLWNRAIGFVTRPLLVLDTLRAVRLRSLAAEAATEENWPQAAKHFPSEVESPSLLRSVTRPLTNTPSSLRRFLELHFKHLARRRMGATALGVRLFELDHGHRPTDLNTLVPDYLPAVPVDPFSAVGATIRYKPEAERPILYSVGIGGEDNGGVMARGPDKRIDFYRSDIMFYLDGKLTDAEHEAPESSSKTDPDGEDGEDGKGQAHEDQTGQGTPE